MSLADKGASQAESIETAEPSKADLAEGSEQAVNTGKSTQGKQPETPRRSTRSRTRKTEVHAENAGLGSDDSLGDKEEAMLDSEDEFVMEVDSEEEAAVLDDDDDDDFHFPPGLGGPDTRPREVVQQLHALFSSEDEDDEDEDANMDFLEDGDNGTNKRKKAKKKVAKTLPMKEEATIFYQLAQKEYAKGNFEDAIIMIEETIKIDPNSKLPYVLLDAIYLDQGDTDKALKAKVAAALLDKNKDDWIDVARISVEKELYDQAILFYRRAINLDDGDYYTMYELVELYIRVSQLSQACDLMKKIHTIYPASAEYTSQLARIYMMQDMLQDAVNLFENILLQNKENPYVDPELVQPFGWSELNSLAELYYKQGAWHKAIRSIKSISRWLLDRGSETWWDEQKTDAEFDERRFEIKRVEKARGKDDPSKYQIPLDIRAKLLLSRLQLGDIEEAKHHSKFLLDSDPDVYLDLFWEVGSEFMELGYYDTGLQLLVKLLDNGDAPSELLLAIGKCEMGLEKWDEAEIQFRAVLRSDPQNLEALVGLAETCYALDRDSEARVLIEEVQDLRQDLKRRKSTPSKKENTSPEEDDNSTFYRRTKKKQTAWPRRLTKAELEQAERQATAKVESNFRTLQRYWSQLAQNINNMVAVAEWTQIASGLVEMILSVKRFNRRGARLTIFQKGLDADIDARLEKLNSRIKENEIGMDLICKPCTLLTYSRCI